MGVWPLVSLEERCRLRPHQRCESGPCADPRESQAALSGEAEQRTTAAQRATERAKPVQPAEHLDRGLPLVAEHEDGTRERVHGQLLANHLRQTIDAPPEVDRRDRDQDPHLRRHLEHGSRPATARTNVASSQVHKPDTSMRMVSPSASRISTWQRPTWLLAGIDNSTNSVVEDWAGEPSVAASRRFKA